MVQITNQNLIPQKWPLFYPVTEEHRQQQSPMQISQLRRAAFQRQDQPYHVAVRQRNVLEQLLPRVLSVQKGWTGCFLQVTLDV